MFIRHVDSHLRTACSYYRQHERASAYSLMQDVSIFTAGEAHLYATIVIEAMAGSPFFAVITDTNEFEFFGRGELEAFVDKDGFKAERPYRFAHHLPA